MKDRYDFSKGKRGRIAPPEPEPANKAKITIRIDQDIIDHFLEKAEASGGTIGYQTLINEALRAAIDGPKLEALVRRAVREELGKRGAA
jgi:uncharacterized protein (DUF4415 family)